MSKAKMNFLFLERAVILVLLAVSSVATAWCYTGKHKNRKSNRWPAVPQVAAQVSLKDQDSAFERRYQQLCMGGSRREIIDTLLYAPDLSQERKQELVENLEKENYALGLLYELEYGLALENVQGPENVPSRIETTLADNFKVVLQKNDPEKTPTHYRKVRKFEINFDFHDRSGKGSVPLFIVLKDRMGEVINSQWGSLSFHEQKLNYSAVVIPNLQPADQPVKCLIELHKKLTEKGQYEVQVYHPYSGLIGGAALSID